MKTTEDTEYLISILERALPYLEKNMADDPQSELINIITDIHDFIASYYDYT